MDIKNALRCAWVLPVAIAADRLTKAWAAKTPNLAREVIPGILGFRYLENTGAAFSMFSGATAGLIVITLVLVLGVAAYLLFGKNISKAARLGLWLVVSGGLGNLYDRVAYGYVVDFIEPLFMNFAVFNVADICVCVGGFLTVIAFIYEDIAAKRAKNGAA